MPVIYVTRRKPGHGLSFFRSALLGQVGLCCFTRPLALRALLVHWRWFEAMLESPSLLKPVSQPIYQEHVTRFRKGNQIKVRVKRAILTFIKWCNPPFRAAVCQCLNTEGHSYSIVVCCVLLPS